MRNGKLRILVRNQVEINVIVTVLHVVIDIQPKITLYKRVEKTVIEVNYDLLFVIQCIGLDYRLWEILSANKGSVSCVVLDS